MTSVAAGFRRRKRFFVAFPHFGNALEILGFFAAIGDGFRAVNG
jgi:hypothetical protein